MQVGCETFAVAGAPPLVVETAMKAAKLMGGGLHGVDPERIDSGAFVTEVNENPKLYRAQGRSI